MSDTYNNRMCPCCWQSSRIPSNGKSWIEIVPGLDEVLDTNKSQARHMIDMYRQNNMGQDEIKYCTNCGGQYPNRFPVGIVKLNDDGTPHVHEYVDVEISPTITAHTCPLCGDSYKTET